MTRLQGEPETGLFYAWAVVLAGEDVASRYDCAVRFVGNDYEMRGSCGVLDVDCGSDAKRVAK